MSQRILNILHLLLGIHFHFWILFLRLIITLDHIQPTHPLNLCNIRSMYIRTILVLHIIFNLSISRLALNTCHIRLIQFHLNIIIRFLLGQKYNRLNGITLFPQNLPYLLAVNINRKVKLYRLQRHF